MSKLSEVNEKIAAALGARDKARSLRDSLLEGRVEFQLVRTAKGCHERIHHEVDGVACCFEQVLGEDIISEHPVGSKVRYIQEAWHAADNAETAAIREFRALAAVRDGIVKRAAEEESTDGKG